MLRTIMLVLTGLTLTACQPGEGEQKEPGPPATDTCGAARYDGLIGTPVSAADFSNHDALRIIPPGTAVTMDYRADRLNVETDAAGLIKRIFCG